MAGKRRTSDGGVIGKGLAWLLATPLLAAFVVLGTASVAQAAPNVDCSPTRGVSFICGVTNVEDFAPVPNSAWVIGGDLSTASNPQGSGSKAEIFLFEAVTGTRAAAATNATRAGRPAPILYIL